MKLICSSQGSCTQGCLPCEPKTPGINSYCKQGCLLCEPKTPGINPYSVPRSVFCFLLPILVRADDLRRTKQLWYSIFLKDRSARTGTRTHSAASRAQFQKVAKHNKIMLTRIRLPAKPPCHMYNL